MTDDDLLYFLSIPKTASTTLYHILARYFPPEQVAPIQPFEYLVSTSVADIWRYRLIGGHFFYNVEPVFGRKPIYITMLRDPVERALSYYAHIRRADKHYAHERVIKQSLRQFVDDERNLPLFGNMHVRYLGQNRNIPGIVNSFDRETMARGALICALEGYAPNGFDDIAMLETARKRLCDFAFFGLKERFGKSVALLCKRFDWKPPEHYDRLMVNPNPFGEVERYVIDALQEANHLDYALYNEFSNIFFDRVRECGIT